MSVQLDPLTGLPVDLADTTFGQLPLNSQPLNLDDLGALGKQTNWLYPDNIIPTLSHLQAQNTPGANTAQSLSTDGKHNLNVNLAGNTTGAGGPWTSALWPTILLNSPSSGFEDPYYPIIPCPDFLYGISVNGEPQDGGSGNFGGVIQVVVSAPDDTIRIPLAILRSVGKTAVIQQSTVMFPLPLALKESLGNPEYAVFRMLNPGIDWDISMVIYISNGQIRP